MEHNEGAVDPTPPTVENTGDRVEHTGDRDDAATPDPSPLPGPVPLPSPDAAYTESGVPTFEGVREKIETRYASALGATELAEETPEVRTAEQRYAARQRAAADKLEEIRASMHKPAD